MLKPIFFISAAIVIIGENPDYNNCNNYPDPYAGAEDSVGVIAATAGVTAVGIIVAEVTHYFFTSLNQQPQSLWQLLELSQQSSLFIKRRITRMINHNIVLLSPPQQFLFPNKLNTAFTSFLINHSSNSGHSSQKEEGTPK